MESLVNRYTLMKDVPQEERPRERMLKAGPSSLSNAELLALLLRTGSTGESVLSLAHRVLAHVKGLKGLTQVTIAELMEIHGIGLAKAVQIMAGVELGQRISRLLPEERYVIRSPKDAAHFVMDELRFENQEQFICIFLNTKFHVIEKKMIFKGTLNASVVHPREVFREAVRCSAAALICVHNHPSGDPTPSQEDLEVTCRLVKAGKLMGIELIDHLIIGDQSFYSMKEHGYIPDE